MIFEYGQAVLQVFKEEIEAKESDLVRADGRI
jgi:hypothetical protein